MRQKSDGDGKTLPLVEEFFSVQGEGFHTGKAAWFIRLGGCDIGCSWCDTRFSWNASLHPLKSTDDIVKRAEESGTKSVVVTGGEPLMWNLDYLCIQLKERGMLTFLETSGAYPLSGFWDWICLSPKKNNPPGNDICRLAGELKIVVGSESDFEWAELQRPHVSDNCKLFLQPEWSRYKIIIPLIVDYVKKNQEWNISLQAHKFMHIP
jgi:organic radical activating enzyme